MKNEMSTYDDVELTIINKMKSIDWKSADLSDVNNVADGMSDLRRSASTYDHASSKLSITTTLLLGQSAIVALGMLTHAPKPWLLLGVILGNLFLVTFLRITKSTCKHDLSKKVNDVTSSIETLAERFPVKKDQEKLAIDKDN